MVLVRKVQTNTAWGKITTLAGRKVVLYSLPFEHLSFCASAPSPHISELLFIGWPLVVGFYVVGGSLRWEEDGLEKYKVSWDECVGNTFCRGSTPPSLLSRKLVI